LREPVRETVMPIVIASWENAGAAKMVASAATSKVPFTLSSYLWNEKTPQASAHALMRCDRMPGIRLDKT
jgi:hypothetical protein